MFDIARPSYRNGRVAMWVPQSLLCVPDAERHPGMRGSHSWRLVRLGFGWDWPLQPVFTNRGSDHDQRGCRRRIADAVSTVALVLLVESLVGHAATILAFAMVVAIGLCGWIVRPLLLV